MTVMDRYKVDWVCTQEGKFTDVLDQRRVTSSRIPGHIGALDVIAKIEAARDKMAVAA